MAETGEDAMTTAVKRFILGAFALLAVVAGMVYGVWWLVHHVVTK